MDNEDRLFPLVESPREEHQEDPISSGTRWALHLTTEDDQRLSQQRILCQEFKPGSGQIGECPRQQGMVGRQRPQQQTLGKPIGNVLEMRLSEISKPATDRLAPS